MGRHYSVELHPQKTAIERDILQGIPNASIAKKYENLNTENVRRYRNERMSEMLRHAQLETVDGLVGRINEYMDTVEDLKSSIITVLEDPERPGHICYYPRAEEIKVKYYDKETQKSHIAKLQSLLDQTEKGGGYTVKGAYVEGQDPRITLLKTAEVLNRQLELLSKARGYITEDNNITINAGASGTVEDIANIAREALAPYPEALDAFVNALLDAAAEGDNELKKQLEARTGEAQT